MGYLRTSPEVAMSRVKSRSRQEEEAIPIEYYQRMHQLHENWLIHKNSSMLTKNALPQVIIIDLTRTSPPWQRHTATWPKWSGGSFLSSSGQPCDGTGHDLDCVEQWLDVRIY